MFPKAERKKNISLSQGQQVACAAKTPGSSGRSEAALTASNESLSVRRRPSARKIYKRTLVQKKKKKLQRLLPESAASGTQEKEFFTRRTADGQLRGVAEVARRR